MGDENPIRTLGDYSRPSHEGYRNTIELPEGNNLVPLRFNSIRLVQNECSFHGLWSENPNQHLKDFLKLVDSLDLDGENMERTRLRRKDELLFSPAHPHKVEGATTEEPVVEYLDTFLTRDELTYHRYLMSGPIPSIFLRNPIITKGCPHNLKIPCNIGYVHIEKAYIDLNSPLNIMTRMMYNWIVRRKLNPGEGENGGISNFTRRIKGMHVFVGNFTYGIDFTIVEDISSILDPGLSQVVLGRPFIEISNMTHDPPEGYLRNEEDKRRGVEYVISKILGFYKECLELGPGYLTGNDNEEEVTDTVKNPKLGNHLISSARSYPTMDPQCSIQIHGLINTITICPKQESQVNGSEVDLKEDNSRDTNSNPNPQPNLFASIATEQVQKLNSMLESLELIIRDNDEPQNEDPHEVEGSTTKEPVVEYFDTFPSRDELTYHMYLMSGPIPSIFLRNPIIMEGCPHNLKIPCNIEHIMRRKLNPREGANGGISNFMRRIKGMHVFVGNFTYVIDFIIVEDISSILDPRLSQVVLGRPFIEISNMTHDPPEGVVRFIRGTGKVAYKMPHKIEQYDSLSDLEKEHTKSVYLRNEEDKRRGVEYVMSKILGFYKEYLELGPKYLTGIDNEKEVT
uniref:Retrotransposon Orf1 n=1 Tax=Tanacetum cinerariifolium TaxID=118510 RepID=A0A699GPK9_TANCI|nr:retrotransposon Orf1 [Tanacetum cinerariifolium]